MKKHECEKGQPCLSARAEELLLVYFACTAYKGLHSDSLTDEEVKLIREICEAYKERAEVSISKKIILNRLEKDVMKK